MNRISLFTTARSWVVRVALIGMMALIPARQIQAIELDPSSEQTVEILALLSAVHELTSYNGDAEVRSQHLAAWEPLWAEDATFTIRNPNANDVRFEGRDNIMNFFRGAAFFNRSWIGLSPSFRTQVVPNGNTAEVYIECIFLDQNKTVTIERSLNGTVKKIRGQWRFWHMNNDPAAPLFP